MRSYKINSLKIWAEIFPDFFECRRRHNIMPGDSVDVGKQEFLVGRTDQMNRLMNDLTELNPHQSDRARAVAILVCRFEINCQKLSVHSVLGSGELFRGADKYSTGFGPHEFDRRVRYHPQA